MTVTSLGKCTHSSLTVSRVDGGFIATCLDCGLVGKVDETPFEARKRFNKRLGKQPKRKLPEALRRKNG